MTFSEWVDLLLAVALIAVTLWAAVATWRQARTSQAMVKLNEQLTQTAKAALESSQRQAEAADRSIAELQRQAHLAAVPILQVDMAVLELALEDSVGLVSASST